jgi:FAD synthase
MFFTSHVIKGLGIGKKLGFPTINLIMPKKLENNKEFQQGIYACKLKIADNEKEYAGAMFYGTRKTMNLGESLEIYILDFENRDLYNKKIKFQIIQKIREVEKFNTTKELIKAIKKDINMIRKIIYSND